MTEEQEDTGFLIPNVYGGDSMPVHVNAPRLAANEVSAMVRDLMTGELLAGFALLDWLRERAGDDYERRNQLFNFQKLLRAIIYGSIRRAEETETRSVSPDEPRRFTLRVAHDWEQFKAKVTELFAFDLFEMADALRFVNDVMKPGKLNGYGETV